MNADRPLISVIIPVYNCERYLREAIESVIAQAWRPLEIVLVDDGSTDGSAVIAQEYAPLVRYLFQQNSGVCTALRQGIIAASGDFFSFIDADDLWPPEKLQLQMTAFQKTPHSDIVFGYVKQFFSPDLEDSARISLRIPAETVPGYSTGTMLIKRDSFFKAGQFDSPWKKGPFVHWYARAQEKGLVSVMLPDILMMRRIHRTNVGITLRSSKVDYIHIVKQALDRRRTGNKGETLL